MNEELKESCRNILYDIYEDGRLNGQLLASSYSMIQSGLLNSIIHPLTIADAEAWMKQQESKGAPYAVKKPHWYFESGSQKNSIIIGVHSPSN